MLMAVSKAPALACDSLTKQCSKRPFAVSDAFIVEVPCLREREEPQRKCDGKLEAIDHETPNIEQHYE